jgi:expansin (peptidoglycan-binding protein)
MRSLVLFALLFSSSSFSQSECPITVYSGTATYYGDGSGGTCSFPNGEIPVNFCSVNTIDYATAALCGACLEVTGAAGTSTVYVVNEFIGASSGFLDLSEVAFQETVGQLSQGTGSVSWKVINCPDFTSLPIELTNVASNPWYVDFVIHKHVNPIASVEIFVGGVWQSLTRQNYNSWVNTGITMSNETVLAARVTDIFGQQVLVNDIDMTNTAQTYLGEGNFTPCSAADLSETEQKLQILQGPGSITIKYAEQPTQILLNDLLGKEIKTVMLQSTYRSTEISTSELPIGLYYITIDFESNNRVSRMVRR